ncbi:MAG: TlyA family RNA methyltransferase [Desulfurivibrio sp.]
MKERLDKLLVARGLAPNLPRAQGLIAAGLVRLGDQVLDKAGTAVVSDAPLTIKENPCPYVSRGGLKLVGALDHFSIDPGGLVCLDIGASTGGFSDCLLQRGAARVYAVDVGYGQLAWKLRQDPRVVVMERTNARHLAPGDLPATIDLAVIDASFISLKLLLPPIMAFLRPGARIIALIKPQFEVGRGEVGKGGVVRDQVLQEEVVAKLRKFALELKLDWVGVVPSPILGPKGNREFLACMTITLTPPQGNNR